MTSTRRTFLQTVTAGGLVLPARAAAPQSIDVGRQLFVDDFLVEETTLKRTFHKPTLHPASPVLKAETPVELNNGVMPAAGPFSDGVWYDPKDKLYKMWYIAGYDDGIAHATSEDGIRWRRPMLDVVPGTNRVFVPPPGLMRNGNTVWLDKDATDPDERFKMFVYLQVGTGSWPRVKPAVLPPIQYPSYVYTSPDGIHWRQRARTGGCGDNTSMHYNPFRKMWSFSIRKGRKGLGRCRSIRETPNFVGGAAWQPEDVREWLACDEKDIPDPVLKMRPELYKVDCVAYESRMLGLFGIYYGPPNDVAYYKLKTPKTNDLHVAFSRDGIDFERPDRTALIRCTREVGNWNCGYLHAAGGCCLIVGDEIRIYFAAFSGLSPAQGTGPFAGMSTGLAVMRRDGFTSYDGPGTLTTRPVTFSGRHMFVNAKAGEIKVEVLDENGKPIAPFTAANCPPIRADKTKQPVSWKGAPDLARLAGRPVRFRFQVAKGELYAYWVSPDRNGASHGYVAAGGPGFTGSTDTTGA